jgi:acyl-CoA synthetase (AMP-forming)/AMP-acid ligase II
LTKLETLIAAHIGQSPQRTGRKGRMILLTSGTTGSPKGAKQSGGGAGIGTLKAILDRTPWRAEETIVIVAPMFHAWGFSQLIFAASMACTIVTRRKFDPEATLELVDRYQASGLAVVPVMFDRIMELPDDVRSRRSLRFAAASGSRMRPDVVTAFMDQFGDVIYNNYNATEAGMIATATPADLRAAPDTAGKPAGGTRIRILDPDLNELPTGEVGTIYVRNDTQFDGYTEGSTGKGKDFHAGFMSSGDVGYLDEDGRLFVVGRDDEMIVSGGENVYPIEVEKTLAAHPDVAEAAVIGVDDEQYGQRLAAFVVLAPGSTATPETLKQHVRDDLANYKVPRSISVLDELPRGSTGKILRAELQSQAHG